MMLQHFYDEFITFVPMQLPQLLDVTTMQQQKDDDSILLTFELKQPKTLEEVMDCLEDDIALIMLYHHIPSRQTDFGHSCCAYSNPSFGQMFKVNAQTGDNGMVNRLSVTVFDSLEIMCADLTLDVQLHEGRGSVLKSTTLYYNHKEISNPMVYDVIICVFHLLLIAVPMGLYRSERSFMAKFYLAMLRSENARKCYANILIVLLLLFHYVYVCGHSGNYGALLSTIFVAILWSKKRTMRWLSQLHEERQLFVGLSILTMAIVAVPHLYTLSMSVAFLLLAAAFYPSLRGMSEWRNYQNRMYLLNYPWLLSSRYY